MLRNEIILVDEQDQMIGIIEKDEAHRRPLLHRAFSVFLYSGNQMLIQQRALDKYHSGGLWANTCCSHPRPGETVQEAAESRLMEEAGIHCPLKEIFTFTYEHAFAHDLYEHEFDHVLIGEYRPDAPVTPHPEEIAQLAWVEFTSLLADLDERPAQYAPWFQIAAPRVIRHINEKKNGTGNHCL